MIKGFRQIAFLTTGSRILGLLRDTAFAYFLGAGGLFDSWAIAFKIPNLARRIFGEGAASSSFIPVYSEQLENDRQAAKTLACTVVTVVFVLLAGVVLLGEAGIWGYYKFFSVHQGTQLKLALTGLMLPYMIMICVVAILAGVLNSHRHFAAPAAAPIILNIFIITALWIGGKVKHVEGRTLVFIVACAVLFAGVVQLGLQLTTLGAKGILIRPRWQVKTNAYKKIMLLMGPMIIGLTVTQINTLADDLIALWFSGSPEKGTVCQLELIGLSFRYPLWEGALSQLYYSQRLYQFPLGVLGISLATAIFPVMSSDAAKKDYTALTTTICRGINSAVFIAIPATAGLFFVAMPLVAAVFERGQFTSEDTAAIAWILLFYAIGLCGYFSQQICARAFFSVQDSKPPMISAIIAVAVNLILNLTLIWFMGTAGLALSTAICSYLQVVILIFFLRRRFGNSVLDGLTATLLKTLAATAVMSLVGAGILHLCRNLPQNLGANILRLALAVPSAAAVYFLASKILRNKCLLLLTGTSQKQP